jgi:hypothetical protein
MTNYIHRTHNIETGEITEVAYTAAQIAEVEAALAESQQIAQAEAKAEADKASAQAKLATLGLTADEVSALLG